MILSDWIKDYPKQNDALKNKRIIADDILAQLLGFVCRQTEVQYDSLDFNRGCFPPVTTCLNSPLRLNPDNIEVENTDKESGFIDLKLSHNVHNNDYSEKLRKSGLLEYDEEKDNVLAAGIIYTEIIYGEPFYYDEINGDMIGDELLKKMITVESSERIKAKEALSLLSLRYDNKSTVNVNYIESDTGMTIHTEIKETNGAIGEFIPLSEVRNEMSSVVFHVQDTGLHKVYFRTAPICENIICSPMKRSQECNIGLPKRNFHISVGLDFGMHKVNVSCVNENGDVSDIFGANPVGKNAVYPISCVYTHDNELEFGNNAVRFHKENRAELIYIFDNDFTGSIDFTTSTGNKESIAAKDVLEKFLNSLKRSILERLIADEGQVSFVYTLPNGFEEPKKERMREALNVCGFGNSEITSGCAAVCWILNDSNEKANDKAIIVIDAGENAVHVEVVRPKAKNIFETLYSKDAPGGAEISRELLHIVNNSVVKDSPNYMNDPRNAEAIKNGVDVLKRSVTYTYQNDRMAVKRYVIINDGQAEHKQSIKQNRKAMERIAQPVVNKVKAVFSECREYCEEKNISVSNVVVFGGGSLLTQLMDSVKQSFSELPCKIEFAEYLELVSRGAAIYGCFNYEEKKINVHAEVKPIKKEERSNGKAEPVREIKSVSAVTTKEYGIQIMSSVRSDIVFKTMISCSKKYDNNRVEFDYPYTYKVTGDELQTGECSLVLYTREAGKENVRNTLEDNCGAIKALGKLIFKLPSDFNSQKDFFMINMYVDRSDRVFPEIEWRRKTLGIFRSDNSKVMKQKIEFDFKYIKL